MIGLFEPIYQDEERYTFKASESGTQTLYRIHNTWGLYKCDRCGENTTGLYKKGDSPRLALNHNCNPFWIFDRKNRGVFRLKKILP